MDIEPAAPVFGDVSLGTVDAPAAESEPTLAEHEAEYAVKGRHDSRAPDPPKASAGTEPAPGSDGDATDPDARDDKGRFKAPRHRAKSQQATAADAPRIAELTRKLRETETTLATERQSRQTPPPAAQPAPQAPSVPRGTSEQPPQLKTFVAALKAGEDYDTAVQQHAEALADFKLDQRDRQHAEKQAERKFFEGFKTRVEAATAKYPDFKAVALDAPSRIPEGSTIDRWIWEHKLGPDVLYHFQKHDAELTRVLALPLLEQIEELALLGQRISSPARVPPAPPAAAPRPPNPIRTAPAKPADEAPGDDISLAEHEKHYGPKRRR